MCWSSGTSRLPWSGDNDVLVRVRAAGCGPDVWHLMTGRPYFARLMVGVRKPKVGVRGWDLAGRVEAVGSAVTGFQPGEEVMGTVEGSFAELAIAPPDKLVPRPRPSPSPVSPPCRPCATRQGCGRDRRC
jgi:NADPH:quinone reductase-like Zn-dependent oxidoreductase